MLWVQQIGALAEKDLLIFRRRWISTVIRALIVPFILTFVLNYLKYWTAQGGVYGVGQATPILDFGTALSQTGARPRFIIVDNGFTTGDIAQVVQGLSEQVRQGGKDLHVISNSSELGSLCPSSNGGVSNCYGAVEFLGSPDHGSSKQWNYTIYGDAALSAQIDVTKTNNDVQLYVLPFEHAINTLIAQTDPNSPALPTPLQYPFTEMTEAQKETRSREEYLSTVDFILAFAFFIGLTPLIYHCAGHLAHQREQGMLALIDAMMPIRQKWRCITIRMVASHMAFDVIYLPGWLIMGGLMTIAFPNTSVGYMLLLYILAGLATTSYSILAGALFRKVQLSGIAAIITAIVLAVVAQLAEGPQDFNSNAAGAIVTGLLFPPCAFVYILEITALFEVESTGLSLSQNYPNANTMGYNWALPAAVFYICFVVQIFLFPLVAVIIEHRLHGTDSPGRKVLRDVDMGGSTVRLRGFSKKFKSRVDKKATVQAVDNLSLDLYNGSITVLLGANGSGKSTTLTSIAGLQKVSAGTIEIDGTGGFGICPQSNIMWDDLSAEEHVKIFSLLKATSSQPRNERREEITRLIDGCDLSVKRTALSKTLSGGQKRKLQLAMMLAGGSRVCCIDEATSGIDPLARRRIWDILMAERDQRSILLTTHFLDEAEVLSDNVVVLSKGVLKASGSVATLKAQLGGGFKVLLGDNSKDVEVPDVADVQRTSDYNRAVFIAPDSATLARLVGTLDQSNNAILHEYTIHGPTLEEIFLSLSDEMQGDSDLARELSTNNPTAVSDAHAISSEGNGLVLETGRGSTPIQQTGVLFQKRLTILKHNYMPYISALFVSLAVAGLVTLMFTQNKNYAYPYGVPCSNPTASVVEPTYRDTLQDYDIEDGEFVFGSSDGIAPSQILNFIPTPTYSYYGSPTGTGAIAASISTVSSLSDFNTFVSQNLEDLNVGGIFVDPKNPVIVWPQSVAEPILMQGLLDSILLNQTLNVGYAQFAERYTPSDSTTSFVAVFTILGFAVYPGLFALYPTAERLRNVRAMQYSNGIKSSSLWSAYALFDLMFIMVISVFTVVIWAAQWKGWYALTYMFVVFFLYGLAGTSFSYVVSLFVPSQLAAFAFTAVIQVVIAMLYLTGYVISAATAPVDQIYNWFNYIHYTVALVSPAASLYRALMITLNNYSLACQGDSYAPYPGAISLYGAPILYLTVQFMLFAAFLMFWESGRSLEVFGITFRQKTKEVPGRDAEKAGRSGSTGSDASEDAAHMSTGNDGLRVANLSKSFGSTQAVDNVTFGVLPSEKFALLGPNGAGKSTTISLIRGDLKPDRGSDSSVHIGNHSLYQTPVAARNQLGVCPQFDATDTMTLREHLVFYARARGVPNRNKNINELITRLGLEPHANKLVKKLSGGTHRKLSLSIALLANPRCLLLDEPSSGMDPAAKRALWRTLRQTAAGRVLLLTTHSMEEAAALCDRAGILAGQLLALGTIEQLRRRHGPAACVYLVHRSAPHATAAETQQMRDWAMENFPSAIVEERAFGGQLRFAIPRAGRNENDNLMGQLFRKIEEAREDLGIVDYSIGPATLDQVFLDVIERHGVQEENTEQPSTRRVWPWKK